MIAISEFEIFWGWKKKHIYIANQKDRERKKEFHYATGFFSLQIQTGMYAERDDDKEKNFAQNEILYMRTNRNDSESYDACRVFM